MCQNLNCLNNELKTLLIAIEDLRKELNNKADQSNVFQDPEVIELSQKLDALLNEFYNLSLPSQVGGFLPIPILNAIGR